MIRINLLAVERQAKKKKATFQSGQKVAAGCAFILILTGAAIGWRFWTISHDSAELDRQIATSQAEATRLHSIIQQVQQFEQQKAQLQQRVVLIEQLRKSQKGPVHMLDQVSRSLPAMMWLTNIKQDKEDSIVIDGKSTTQTGVSDFVNNLEGSGYFKKSVDIVSSTTDAATNTMPEIVKFSVKAAFQTPGEPAAATTKPAVGKK
jgi:Tfp pilus assembly protein PilN